MDFGMPAGLLDLQAEARQVGASAAVERSIREDSWVVGFSRPFAEELGRRGWLGMTWPAEFGGAERSALERFVVMEAMIGEGAPLASCWVGERQIGPVLLAYGSEAQRTRHLPALVAGRACWALGISEPDAGSDLAGIRTRATSTPRGFVVDGVKVWTSFGADADYCYLIARTDPEAPVHKGLSEFIVPMDRPGVTVRRIRDMTGAEHFCEVVFDGCLLGPEDLVGRPNESWRQLMSQLEHERGGIDRLVGNLALFRDIVRRCNRSDPLVRQKIATLESAYRTGRLMVLRELLKQGPPAFSAVVKVFCTELEQQVAEFAGQVCGAGGLIDPRVSRAMSYAPAYSIQGGTNSILRNVIGERILGLPR